MNLTKNLMEQFMDLFHKNPSQRIHETTKCFKYCKAIQRFELRQIGRKKE